MKHILSLTPRKRKIEAPLSPVVKFDDLPKITKILDIKNKLREFRFTFLKYIVDQHIEKVVYLLCFDPYGQTIFVEINDDIVINYNDEETIFINSVKEHDYISFSIIENYTEKTPHEIYGMILYNGFDYVILKRNDKGLMEKLYYITDDSNQEHLEKLKSPHVYTLVTLEEIEHNAIATTEIIKYCYNFIHNEQVLNNKFSMGEIVDNVNELHQTLEEFDTVYDIYLNKILKDWANLNNQSSYYYEKYGLCELTEKDKNIFDLISLNMFSRFQSFTGITDLIDSLSEINMNINLSNEHIKIIISEIKEKYEELKINVDKDNIKINL